MEGRHDVFEAFWDQDGASLSLFAVGSGCLTLVFLLWWLCSKPKKHAIVSCYWCNEEQLLAINRHTKVKWTCMHCEQVNGFDKVYSHAY